VIKFIKIVIVFLLLSISKSFSDQGQANCYSGTCTFYPGKYYTYGETTCLETLEQEDVIQDEFGFTVIETDKWCVIFNDSQLEVSN